MAQQSDKVLFFIPDISGFTRFIAETEIKHSQHIIKDLLETLVDSNSIGLKVSEFEGDAVLFYRTGAPPRLADCIEQARRMFVNFHTSLQRSELSRICQCGACRTASGLTLKIVAHLGPAIPMQVKDHAKFIGPAVIVAHRLLKNSIADHEYLLLSGDLIGALPQPATEVSQLTAGSDSYDEIGAVEYRHLSLGKYLAEVKVEPPATVVVKNRQKVLEITQHIEAPAESVYQAMIDLPGRMKWIAGIKQVQLHDPQPNQIGSVHRCVRAGGDPDLITTDVKITDTTMEFWETDVKKFACCRYLLRKTASNTTDVVVEFFVQGNVFVKLVFKALMEKKLRAGFTKSLANLAALCEGAAH
jgi:Protein of unknown function (DUF2652)/Polyketide cyclase / dehydrase and lipid transport